MEHESCPVCDGESTILGVFGSRLNLRCRDCGSDWSIEVEPAATWVYDTDLVDCLTNVNGE